MALFFARAVVVVIKRWARGHGPLKKGSFMRAFFVTAAVVVIALLAFARPARAEPDDARPVIVEYVAPSPECASASTFLEILRAEVARNPRVARPWRFVLQIVREGDGYVGTLTTRSGKRTVRAPKCDDVTASLALIIAMAEPEAEAAPPPAPSPIIPKPRDADLPPSSPSSESRTDWRIGLRGLASDHGVEAQRAMLGAGLYGSIELPYGLTKMLFEVGVGTETTLPASSVATVPYTPGMGSIGFVSTSLSYWFIDTQSCLLDLPLIGDDLRALGCIRLAGAAFHSEGNGGGAFWPGLGARLRWQARFNLFAEVAFEGVYGTVSSGESLTAGWVDGALSLGYRL
jgi:hypothetical protein